MCNDDACGVNDDFSVIYHNDDIGKEEHEREEKQCQNDKVVLL